MKRVLRSRMAWPMIGIVVILSALLISKTSSATSAPSGRRHASTNAVPFKKWSTPALEEMHQNLSVVLHNLALTQDGFKTYLKALKDPSSVPVPDQKTASKQINYGTIYLAGEAQTLNAHIIYDLPKKYQPEMSGVILADRLLVKVDKQTAIDMTTPWAGPGAPKGITKSDIVNRLARDQRELSSAYSPLMRAYLAITAVLTLRSTP